MIVDFCLKTLSLLDTLTDYQPNRTEVYMVFLFVAQLAALDRLQLTNAGTQASDSIPIG